MKFIIITSIFLFSIKAQASFFQTNCSNADATIRTGSGHRYNGVTISTQEADGSIRPVEFSNDEILVQVIENSELRRVEVTSCVPGESGGGAMSQDVWTYQRVQLRRADSQTFDENTIGVSEDRRHIDTDFICHDALTSRTWCP